MQRGLTLAAGAWGPPFTATGHESAYFLSVNRNKHSLAIDLKHAKGVELIRRLAARCDVVVENFPTGKMDAFGLSYAEVWLLLRWRCESRAHT